MAQLVQVVIDSVHPAALARFWAQALDGFEIRPYDEKEVARLAALGLTPENDPTVMLDGLHLEICFQLTQTAAGPNKRPIHFDIKSADRPEEVTRLVSFGASIIQEFDNHTWMQDPEGNDFCVVSQ